MQYKITLKKGFPLYEFLSFIILLPLCVDKYTRKIMGFFPPQKMLKNEESMCLFQQKDHVICKQHQAFS